MRERGRRAAPRGRAAPAAPGRLQVAATAAKGPVRPDERRRATPAAAGDAPDRADGTRPRLPWGGSPPRADIAGPLFRYSEFAMPVKSCETRTVDDFTFSTSVRVRFADTDAQGIAHNT